MAFLNMALSIVRRASHRGAISSLVAGERKRFNRSANALFSAPKRPISRGALTGAPTQRASDEATLRYVTPKGGVAGNRQGVDEIEMQHLEEEGCGAEK
jgi:hypothetical protein